MPRPKLLTDSPKREAILNAALEVFVERGFHGATMPEIADVAGVGTGTLYRYFLTKETLVNELFRHWKTTFASEVVSADLASDARGILHILWRGMWAFQKKHPKVVRFLELHHHAPYLDEESRRVEERILAPLRAFVETAQRLKQIRRLPPELLIAMVHGAFLGLLHAEARHQIAISDDLLDHAEEGIWAMLGGQ